MTARSRTLRTVSLILTPLTLLSIMLVGNAPTPIGASSHREAPLIASDPDADNTDVYAFVSPDRNDALTLVADYIPLEWPEGGPNYHKFSDDVLYEIHIDNVGDGKSHITYQFQFKTTIKNPKTFLYATGPIASLTDPNWNISTSYDVTEVVAANNLPPVTTVLATNLLATPVNIGPKSTPNYPQLAQMGIQTVPSAQGDIKLFAGPRDDPFFVDLGSIFDLLTLRPQAPPIGYKDNSKIPQDGLAGYNTHSIVMQVPISRLTAGDPVLGVWATASRRATRVLTSSGSSASGEFVQVSRLGNPLVNEAVIPLALKDAFNGLKPEQDFGLYTSGTPAGDLLKTSVLDPELQRLLKGLYNVPNPGPNRTDIQAIFLQGIKTTKPFTIKTGGGDVTVPAGTNVNQPISPLAQPAEMLRINTAPPFRPGTPGSFCKPVPDNQFGLLGGDVCGFPNGRRLADNVTRIELLAVAGAAFQVLNNDATNTFQFNPALLNVLSDGVTHNDMEFLTSFPYVATPHQGAEHYHSSNHPMFASIFLIGPSPRRGGPIE
ncbi:MAG: DUF4331 domain-containing protein [Herpetosiphon sp.]